MCLWKSPQLSAKESLIVTDWIMNFSHTKKASVFQIFMDTDMYYCP